MQKLNSSPKIEELSSSQKDDSKKIKKKLEIKNFLSKGTYIDARDSMNNWCVAHILEVCNDDDTIKVRFDGWGSRWNEWYKFTSARIAPFRKYSKGYTGNARQAIRDWIFDIDELEKNKEIIEKVIETDFEELNLFDITQILRGIYFIFIDNLMCNPAEIKSKETLEMILKVLKLHLVLTVKFLKKLPNLFNDYQKGTVNLDAFLMEENVAISFCIYELVESVHKIFCLNERYQKLYKENYQAILLIPPFQESDYEKKWVLDLGKPEKEEPDSFWLKNQHIEKSLKLIVNYMINYFGEIGGFKEIINLLTIDESKQLIPIKCMDSVFKLLSSTLEYLKDSFKEEMVKLLKTSLEKRFALLTDKEIKDFDKEFASSFINDAKTIFLQYQPEEGVHKLLETLELDLALKYLKSPFFEKKLKGVNEIKEISERIEQTENNSSSSTENYYYPISRKKFMKYLNSEIFLKWISENNVVEILLGDSMHVEIIKRCHDILIFMCKRKFMPPDIINHIWKAGEGKHDSLVRVLYEMIIEISAYLSPESLKLLYEKIKEIPLSNYIELTLNLVKGFTDNVIRVNTIPLKYSMKSESLDDKSIEDQYFGVELLWKAILDSSSLSNNLIEMAIHHIKSITYQLNGGTLRTYFMNKSMNEIKNGTSIPQSLTVATHILQYYSNQRDYDNSLKKILQSLKQFELIDTLIKDLKRYKLVVKNSLKENKASNYLETVYEGKFNHKINLEKRLKMIETIISIFAEHKDPIFTLQHLDELWSIFIKNANHDQDKKIYCQWLIKKTEDGNIAETNVIFATKSYYIHQFKNIFCNKNNTDYLNLIDEEFECFSYLFRFVNFYEQKIKLMKNGKFYVVDIDLMGKSDLWDIFLNTSNPQIVENSSILLVDLHLQFLPTFDKKKKREIQDDFTIKCINLLKQSFNNHNFALLNKSISLIMIFFDKFEGKSIGTEKSKQVSSSNHLMTVTVQLKPDDIKKEVRISYLESLGSFRKKISEEFKIPLKSFKFLNKNITSDLNDSIDDDTIIRDYGWSNIFIVTRKNNKLDENSEDNYHPKKLISDSPEYLDLLFMLLSNPNSGCLNIIWELLMKLPVNEKIKESLYKLEKKWEDLFDENSLYKSLYCLQIIEDFTFNKNNENKLWFKKMQQSNGLNFFLEVYGKQTFENYTNVISKKYIASLLKLINHFSLQWKFPEIYLKNKEKLKKLCLKLLDSITKISDYTIIRQKQNLENSQYEKNQYYIQINERPNENIKLPEFFSTEADIANVCLDLLLNIINHSPDLVETIYNYPNLEYLLSISLIKTDNTLLKKKMSEGIIQLFEECLRNVSIQIPAQEVFLPILWNKFFDTALENGQQSDIYFEILQKNIEMLPLKSLSKKSSELNKYKSEVDLEGILYHLVDLIKTKPFFEKNHQDKDNILIGILNLINSLLKRTPEKAFEIGQTKGLLQELLGPCLFETPRKSMKSDIYPKCKSYYSRCAAFNLIFVLGSDTIPNMKVILDYLLPLHLKADWRTKSISDWNIIPKINEKSTTGYVGLKNLGCICYMNSLIQQFYMIPSFRKEILEVEDKNFQKVPNEDNLLYQLKCLFLALKESEKQYFNPKNFCQAFKDWEGNATNVYEQRDVDEFFNMFLDKLENVIKGTKNENFIKKHFGGVLSNELICKGCPHYSEREEQFLAISLQVKNKKTIQESLASFVEGEMLEGDNAYLCEQCEKKVPTLKRVCLKKLPNHMILVLKRFEFDFDNMSKVKVNDSCEFPMTINFENFTQQGLRKQERKKNQEKGAENNDEDENWEYDQKYFEYKLKGIVIHMGIADSGHYYSLIQERGVENGQANWYEFNDTIVKNFEERDIPDEAFGGEEKWSYYNMNNIKEKIKNAYLLFYERIVPYEEEIIDKVKDLKKEESKELEVAEPQAESKKEVTMEILKPVETNQITDVSVQDHLQEEFLKEILKDNLKFHIHKNIFSIEYFSFIVDLVSKRKYDENNDYLEYPFQYDEKKNPKKYYDLEILKLGTIFLLTCIMREKNRQNLLDFLPFLKKQLSRSLPASVWLLYSFTNRQIIDEFVLSCLEKNMREFTTGILYVAMKRVYLEEGEGLKNRLFEADANDYPTTVLANFINVFINLIYEAKAMTRDYTEFFLVFYYFAKLGPETAHYLIKKRVIGRLVDFFFVTVRDFQDIFRKFNDVKFLEVNPSLIGQPEEAKKKILSGFEEMRQRKKEKMLMESYNNSSKIYLWQTIAELLLYCKLQKNEKNCKWLKNNQECELLNEEKIFLKQEPEYIYKILNDATSKIAVRSISLIYAYLSFDDSKFTDNLMQVLKRGLIEKNANDYRIFFALIKKLLILDDSLQDSRTEKIVACFCKCMQENNKYYNEFVCLQEFLLKMASRYPKIRLVLGKSYSEFCNSVIEYIRNKELASGSPQDYLKVRSNRFLPFNRFASPKTFQEYKEYCEKKIIKLKKLMKGELEAENVDWDSDEDLSEYPFKPEDKFDYYGQFQNSITQTNAGKWVTGQVKLIAEEMINAKIYSNDALYNSGMWISRKSECLAPYMSMQEPIEKEKLMSEIETEKNKENKPKRKKSEDSNTNIL